MASFASSATTGGAHKHAWTNRKLDYKSGSESIDDRPGLKTDFLKYLQKKG